MCEFYKDDKRMCADCPFLYNFEYCLANEDYISENGEFDEYYMERDEW